MDSNEIIHGINNQGIGFILDVVKNDDSFKDFSIALKDDNVKDVLVPMLLNAGEEAQKNSISPFFPLLNDKNYSTKLRDLMISSDGTALLKRVVVNKSGEFLTLGTMYLNYLVAHGFVNTLLQKKEGRGLVVALVGIAASNHAGYTCTALPPLTKAGEKFYATLHDRRKLEETLSDPATNERFINYLVKNETEASAVLANAFCDSDCLRNLTTVLQTEKGNAFCAMVGKSGFGRKSGAGKIWLTKGGRVFVHEMLKTDKGAYAIYAIMTGMSIGEFVAYTVKLESG